MIRKGVSGPPMLKKPDDIRLSANLPCDPSTSTFDWKIYRSWLGGLPGGGLNIGWEAVDRHVLQGNGTKEAIRWIDRQGGRRSYSYAQLKTESDRFASLVHSLGHKPGVRVFTLLGRRPELYIAALGTLKAGGVFSPLYSVFGPDPVRARMTIGEAAVLITTVADYEKKVRPWRHELPSLAHIFLVDGGEGCPDAIDLGASLEKCSSSFEVVRTRPEDMALLHFTSGTTGRPKGAIHVHEAVVAHHATGRLVLDLHPDDIFWCTADPGWVTGTSYGIIAPLTNGVTLVVDEGEFDAERWYATLERERVTVWYSAPTAIRLLARAGGDIARRHDLSRLRFLASVGEPLNAEAVIWSQETFGRPFHDNWWQTETGGIMIANFAAMDVKPGSMGKPVPGVEAAIVSLDGDRVRCIETPMATGQLALRAGWPAMFRGYLGEEARYASCFKQGWYLTGDLAMRDADGYYWFVGRADDAIKTAGHLVGPFEVESVLMAHGAVAEAAAIGLPDERSGEVVKAYVTLKRGFSDSEALRRDILAHARRSLGAAIAPRQVEIRSELPHTRSGKIMRRLLRARELGLPEGDLSTLELLS